ncbi:MAG: hypothetical protein IPJ48_03055 [Propionivibrio sp.]|uniref:Uncharacterized protein n=1 Tax=Candidatus Propionivibrio dominans TaxID=2954373 RepID=A0A9D7I7I3_9RHOO|nr:hypothetical protein [Candidatus Propionivibrio dominans]MBL0166071.1 hypothetical protein [Propionivibrio sp.]
MTWEALLRAALQHHDIGLNMLYVRFLLSLFLNGEGAHVPKDDFFILGNVATNVSPAGGTCQRWQEDK